MVAEQQLFQNKTHSHRKIGFFIQTGFAPQVSNAVDFYFDSGLVWYAPFGKSKNDQLGIGFNHCSMSNHLYQQNPVFLKYESFTELTYQFWLNDNFSLQPGFHYLINPGANSYISDASVLSLRGIIKF